MQCVLSMSDLQILTGISILISGFAQLRCGISCYHWRLLIYLAWFSSLTHLACLTFLRHYLYVNQGERAWRLVAMAILVILLIAAMVPSGNYQWDPLQPSAGFDDSTTEAGIVPQPADYAICYFKHLRKVDSVTFASMVLSVLLVGLGFLSRAARLHKSVSVDVIARARHAASDNTKAILRKVYQWSDAEHTPNGLKRLFVYRPLLALFLVCRVTLDAWSSMFVEVRIYSTY
jgi:hypothetical protein